MRRYIRRGPARAPESDDGGGDYRRLLPILWGTGAGSEVMSRIAAR